MGGAGSARLVGCGRRSVRRLPGDLRATVLEFRRIAENSASPEPAFLHVSRVLGQFPQMELDALNWSIGRPDEGRSRKPAPPGAKPDAQD